MPQSYTPEFKKKIVRLHMEKRHTYKSITASMGYPKLPFPSGAENLTKNARQKPSKIQMHGTDL